MELNFTSGQKVPSLPLSLVGRQQQYQLRGPSLSETVSVGEEQAAVQFPQAVAPEGNRRLRDDHGNTGVCGTLPFTSRGAGVGSLRKPCRSSSGSGKMIVLFFSVAISVNVCR